MTGLPVLSARTRLGLEILAFGAVGGVIGDALLRAMPWGLNVALGTAGLVGAGAWLVRRLHAHLHVLFMEALILAGGGFMLWHSWT